MRPVVFHGWQTHNTHKHRDGDKEKDILASDGQAAPELARLRGKGEGLVFVVCEKYAQEKKITPFAWRYASECFAKSVSKLSGRKMRVNLSALMSETSLLLPGNLKIGSRRFSISSSRVKTGKNSFSLFRLHHEGEEKSWSPSLSSSSVTSIRSIGTSLCAFARAAALNTASRDSVDGEEDDK